LIVAVEDLSVVEGAVAIALLVVVLVLAWMSRKTKRFRAGIFVERNGEEKPQPPSKEDQ
jgi:hypothetical protein